MTRRTKYYTHEARLAAKRAQHAKYSRSDRGKAAQARYLSKRTQQPPPAAIATRVHIPNDMLARAAEYSPVSTSYHDDHGPDLGLRHRPYKFTIPDAEAITILQDDGDESMDLKLHTLQSRWLCAEGTVRFKEWSREDMDGGNIVETGIIELEERIRAWNVLAADERWTKLGAQLREVYLDWGAKRVVWLAEELEIRQKGADAYVAAYAELPPQVLLRTNAEYLDHTEDWEAYDQEEDDDLFAEHYE